MFGYPKFNDNGEKILTTYDNAYKDMNMDIRVYRLNAGKKLSFKNKLEESAILLLSGKINVIYDDDEQLMQRDDLFIDGPWCVHFSRDKTISLEVVEDSEILIQKTLNNVEFDTEIYNPKDCIWKDVGVNKYGNTAKRKVNTIFDKDISPKSNMVLGEVINYKGNWSSYLPHYHPQPEVYYFKFDKENGFGASFIGDDVYKSIDGSFAAIPGNKTHPQAVAPGFSMYTVWMIRHLDNDPWLQTSRYVDDRFDDLE